MVVIHAHACLTCALPSRVPEFGLLLQASNVLLPLKSGSPAPELGTSVFQISCLP